MSIAIACDCRSMKKSSHGYNSQEIFSNMVFFLLIAESAGKVLRIAVILTPSHCFDGSISDPNRVTPPSIIFWLDPV
jgi:hypothetical protein